MLVFSLIGAGQEHPVLPTLTVIHIHAGPVHILVGWASRKGGAPLQIIGLTFSCISVSYSTLTLSVLLQTYTFKSHMEYMEYGSAISEIAMALRLICQVTLNKSIELITNSLDSLAICRAVLLARYMNFAFLIY